MLKLKLININTFIQGLIDLNTIQMLGSIQDTI